jgi:hypothetical protein
VRVGGLAELSEVGSLGKRLKCKTKEIHIKNDNNGTARKEKIRIEIWGSLSGERGVLPKSASYSVYC